MTFWGSRGKPGKWPNLGFFGGSRKSEIFVIFHDFLMIFGPLDFKKKIFRFALIILGGPEGGTGRRVGVNFLTLFDRDHMGICITCTDLHNT